MVLFAIIHNLPSKYPAFRRHSCHFQIIEVLKKISESGRFANRPNRKHAKRFFNISINQ